MTCLRENNQGADLLIGYLEDTLSPAQRKDLESHAEVCVECRELLAMQSMLDEYEAPEVSANFDERLYARIAHDDARPVWSKWFSGWNLSWRFVAPVAAAAAMLVVVLFVTRPHVETTTDDGQKQASVDRDVLQLEQALEDVELLMPLKAPGDAI